MNDHSDIFTVSGCLKLDSIYDYKAGSCNDDARMLIESHLSTCPLCRSAVDAAESVHKKDVQIISASIASRVRKGRARQFSRGRYWLAAASLALILVAALIWRIHPDPSQRTGLVSDPVLIHRPKVIPPLEEMVDQSQHNYHDAIERSHTGQTNSSNDVKAMRMESDTAPGQKEAIAVSAAKKNEQPEAVEHKSVDFAPDMTRHYVKSEVLSFYPVKNYGHKSTSNRLKQGNAFFSVVDRKGYVDVALPYFPGGTTGLETYIDSLFSKKFGQIPSALHGRTGIISFIVNRSGIVTNIEFQNELSKEVDDAISELLNEMPRWNKDPKGGKGRVRYTICLKFPDRQ